MVGQIIGHYKIEALLGEGGMADVYRGRHVTLGSACAVKVIKRELTTDRQLIERFLQEAQTTANLNHPNIVRMYDRGQFSGLYYLVMELLDGETLEQRIEREGKVPPNEAVYIAIQVAKALEAGHAQRIIHRDIKPSNIMVCRNGAIKVMDFGIAKDVSKGKAFTQIGTMVYMPREQVAQKGTDHRADVYSLGVTLYEMVTGQLPPILAQQAPIPPTQYTPTVSPQLESTILKAIREAPEDRFQSVTEFIQALQQSITGIACPRPQCGAPNRIVAKFCSRCGQPLVRLSAGSASVKSQKTPVDERTIDKYFQQSGITYVEKKHKGSLCVWIIEYKLQNTNATVLVIIDRNDWVIDFQTHFNEKIPKRKASTVAFLKLLNQLNRTYKLCQFYITDDYDLIACVQLPLEELDQNEFHRGINTLINVYDEAYKSIKSAIQPPSNKPRR
jgi:serine/threonine protein kinase